MSGKMGAVFTVWMAWMGAGCTVWVDPVGPQVEGEGQRVAPGTWSTAHDARLSNNDQGLYELGVEADGTALLHRAYLNVEGVDRLDAAGEFVVDWETIHGTSDRPTVGRMVRGPGGERCFERNVRTGVQWWFVVDCGQGPFDVAMDGPEKWSWREAFAVGPDGGLVFAWGTRDEVWFQDAEGAEALALDGWPIQPPEVAVGPDGVVSVLAMVQSNSGPPSYIDYEDVHHVQRGLDGAWTDHLLNRSNVDAIAHQHPNTPMGLAVSPTGEVAAAFPDWIDANTVQTVVDIDGRREVLETTSWTAHTVAVGWAGGVLHAVWDEVEGPSDSSDTVTIGILGADGWVGEAVPGSSSGKNIELEFDDQGTPTVAQYDATGATVFRRSDPLVESRIRAAR